MGNLKPFKKGVSGNPAGRPKIPALNVLLAECCTLDEMTKVINALLERAQEGNIRAIEVLLDRIYGKALATIDFTNDNEMSRYSFDKLSTETLREMSQLQQKIKNEMRQYDEQQTSSDEK